MYKEEVSPYAILLSGGQTTTANLFGRMNARGEGGWAWWACGTASPSTRWPA
ncbi:MAG: BREX system Lon protease-like protein BrxL [Adlercreutzia equolifaciens]